MNFEASLVSMPSCCASPNARESVDHAEVDDLGDAAMLARLRKGRDAEDFLRRARMDVLAASKGIQPEHGSSERCARMRSSICE